MQLLFFITVFLFVACKPTVTETRDEQKKEEVEKSMVEVNRILVAKDKKRIEGYIERMGYQMTETETGLWIQQLKTGEGPLIQKDQVVYLSYKLSLLDGTLVYSSEEDGIKSFRVGRGGVESGLEEGILHLSQGAQARLIMPPHMGYGLPGDGDRIPARAILVYEIEVLRVE